MTAGGVFIGVVGYSLLDSHNIAIKVIGGAYIALGLGVVLIGALRTFDRLGGLYVSLIARRWRKAAEQQAAQAIRVPVPERTESGASG